MMIVFGLTGSYIMVGGVALTIIYVGWLKWQQYQDDKNVECWGIVAHVAHYPSRESRNIIREAGLVGTLEECRASTTVVQLSEVRPSGGSRVYVLNGHVDVPFRLGDCVRFVKKKRGRGYKIQAATFQS